MAEITIKFQERALFIPQYAAEEDMKKLRYHDMLAVDIKEFVFFLGCQTKNDMIERAREWEI